MGEVLIKAEGVSKKFAKNLKKSLAYGFSDLTRGILGKNTSKALRKDEFWAVKDVSFEVRRGECLGLIGHNGAGKSTLLKMLNGLIAPDEGTITMHGKIGALIELGAGFNPILTGRENIYNNGAVIGFSKAEIDAKLQDIIAFAELEEFIDMPVQNYSSGMRVRLGFAIAAQMEPDILLIDEVLAVGDLGFILKCFKRIDTILPNTAFIFVSHNMPMVARICNEIILMERGKVLFQGSEVSKGIDAYYNKFSDSNLNVVFDEKDIEILDFQVNNLSVLNDKFNVNYNEQLIILLTIKNKKLDKVPFVLFSIFDKEYRPVVQINGNIANQKLESSTYAFEFMLNNMHLSKGMYFFNVVLSIEQHTLPILRVNNIATMQVIDSEQCWSPIIMKPYINIKFLKHDKFEIDKESC
ncbi:MAG: ABC transporter ATP-binding protein [Flavobacterium sp.]